MNSKLYIQNVSEILEEIVEEIGKDFVLYMDNDSKHISIESLEWYKSNQIKIELGPLHSPDLNPIENLWGIIKIR